MCGEQQRGPICSYYTQICSCTSFVFLDIYPSLRHCASACLLVCEATRVWWRWLRALALFVCVDLFVHARFNHSEYKYLPHNANIICLWQRLVHPENSLSITQMHMHIHTVQDWSRSCGSTPFETQEPGILLQNAFTYSCVSNLHMRMSAF